MSNAAGLPGGEAPNEVVAQNATERQVIPLHTAALLGVAGPETAMRAIIRLADGTIVTGGVSDRIALGRLIEVSLAGAVIELANGNAGFLRPYPYGRDGSPA